MLERSVPILMPINASVGADGYMECVNNKFYWNLISNGMQCWKLGKRNTKATFV